MRAFSERTLGTPWRRFRPRWGCRVGAVRPHQHGEEQGEAGGFRGEAGDPACSTLTLPSGATGAVSLLCAFIPPSLCFLTPRSEIKDEITQVKTTTPAKVSRFSSPHPSAFGAFLFLRLFHVVAGVL